MTAKEIRDDHDKLRQNIRDFIYSTCSHEGKVIEEEGDECSHYSLECNVTLGEWGASGLSTLQLPAIVEIRAYIGQGWIYVKYDGVDEPFDLEDLSTEDALSIVEQI